MSENGVGKDGREGIIVLLYADNLVLSSGGFWEEAREAVPP